MSEDKKIPQVEAQIQLNGVQAMLKTAEGMQSTTDPLPVMEDAANRLKWFKHNSPQFHDECDGNVLDILFDTIAQIKRERGQTDAAEHVDKLKEVRDESNP